MQIPHNSYVLIADGKKSLFFRNEGDGEYPNLVVERKDGHADQEDREIKTDDRGRTAASVGTARSAMDEADFHQQAEDRFAAETAEMLNARALRQEFEQLFVVAPPRTLGELRKHYHKEVEKRLAGELAKDLTSHPVEEIEKILSAA